MLQLAEMGLQGSPRPFGNQIVSSQTIDVRHEAAGSHVSPGAGLVLVQSFLDVPSSFPFGMLILNLCYCMLDVGNISFVL